jgi:hypothetical protein
MCTCTWIFLSTTTHIQQSVIDFTSSNGRYINEGYLRLSCVSCGLMHQPKARNVHRVIRMVNNVQHPPNKDERPGGYGSMYLLNLG